MENIACSLCDGTGSIDVGYQGGFIEVVDCIKCGGGGISTPEKQIEDEEIRKKVREFVSKIIDQFEYIEGTK